MSDFTCLVLEKLSVVVSWPHSTQAVGSLWAAGGSAYFSFESGSVVPCSNVGNRSVSGAFVLVVRCLVSRSLTWLGPVLGHLKLL